MGVLNVDLISIPVWGQFGILGISLALNIFWLTQYIRGELVSRKHVDMVERIGNGYQKAWEISEATKQGQAEVLNKLVVSGDTQLGILRYLKARQAQHPTLPGAEETGDVVE